LKIAVQIFLFQVFFYTLPGQQFYFRGEVKDERGSLLQNVTIRQMSAGYIYRTGNYGTFGITATRVSDTLEFSLQGFQKEKYFLSADKFISITLKPVPVIATRSNKDKLLSLTKDLSRDTKKKWQLGDETYTSLVENTFVDAQKYPVTGVALTIDRASYSNARRFINLDMEVPPDAVRIEEMLNNFDFGYEAPGGDSLFRIKSTLSTCPWNKENRVFYLNIFARKLNLDSLPPTHLVFLVDISGSMDMPNRLPLLKSAFHKLAMNLREKDTISIVIYGGAVGVMLFPTGGNEKEKIYKAIDEIFPGGSTPGEAGIKLAYQIAKKHFIEGGNNRIILATDGDFNVGLKTEQELDELITRNKESGIYLTCLGVGMGNYKDSKIQTLARKGNGNFAYIDSYQEAEKVLLLEFTKTLYTVADDVYMNVTFNPDLVKQYRLIGFDNKMDALADSNAVIEGGEIGSGHSMIAAFEITPNSGVGEKNRNEHFAEVSLQYKYPRDSISHMLTETFSYNPVLYTDLEAKYRFAGSVIMFGLKMKESPFAKDISWGDVLFQASESANPTDINQSQFVELVYKVKNLYARPRKKRGN
jgi:Ca-activated chloride channel homolog